MRSIRQPFCERCALERSLAGSAAATGAVYISCYRGGVRLLLQGTCMSGFGLIRPCTKGLAISALRAIVARAAAPKNLHLTGKISRV